MHVWSSIVHVVYGPIAYNPTYLCVNLEYVDVLQAFCFSKCIHRGHEDGLMHRPIFTGVTLHIMVVVYYGAYTLSITQVVYCHVYHHTLSDTWQRVVPQLRGNLTKLTWGPTALLIRCQLALFLLSCSSNLLRTLIRLPKLVNEGCVYVGGVWRPIVSLHIYTL